MGGKVLNVSQMPTVRPEVADPHPPPLTVSLTAKYSGFFDDFPKGDGQHRKSPYFTNMFPI